MRVIVTGSMHWTDADLIRRALAELPADCVIVHGDSTGADELAGRIAREELGLAVEAFRKERDDYRRHGRAAWQGLHERMLAAGADLVLAFHPDLGQPGKARGTTDMVERARRRGIAVRTCAG
jgi:hypothetical protein